MDIMHVHFKTIGSTNTWAKEHVQDLFIDQLTLVTADEQTAGRGRFKRVWQSPFGLNIYATFCFFIEQARSDIGHVPQLLALSTAKALETLAFKPALKWPNDILLDGKKVGGILCETIPHRSSRCVICGIGLNVNMPKEELMKIDRPATSLLVEGGKYYLVSDVLKLVNQAFCPDLELFVKNGFDSFFPAYRARSYLKQGQAIRFHDNQKIIDGIFYALNPDGSITLQVNQELKTFYAGEFIN